MRLLLITQDFPPDVGGTQTYAYELSRCLAARCEDFAVIAPARPGAEAIDAEASFDVVRVRASYDALSIRALAPVLGLTRRRGFEAAFHVQWPTVLASLLARPVGGPRRIFVAAHGRELLLQPLAGIHWLDKGYNGVRNWALRHTDRLFPVSRYTGALLQERGVPADRITVVNSGTDPSRFYPADASDLRRALGLEGRSIILTISRLVPRKGIDTVLRALPEVTRTMPDVAYLVGGSGPDRERLETLARDLSVDDRVHFVGRITNDDLLRYYNACDVFVMPSREDTPYVEGFGLVFLEAGACGKPVVGARSGGIPDAVRDGETGLLVAPDDAPGLAAALLRLLRDADLAGRLGRLGRQHVVEKANWDYVATHLYEAMKASL